MSRRAADAPTRRTRLAGAALVACAAALLVLPMPADWVERTFAVPIYPHWQRAATGLSNRIPFAGFDACVFAIVAVLVLSIARAFRKPGSRVKRLLGAGFALLQSASVLYVWFMLSWGLNYRRLPAEARMDFDIRRVTAEAADALAARTASELNRLHPIAHAERWPEWPEVPRLISPALPSATRSLGLPASPRPGRPHVSILQTYFRWASIEGMTDPFLLDVLVNDDLLPFERPAMVAHEWGHLAGLAQEAEASYFGWRLCLEGGAQPQYSAWLFISGLSLGSVADDRRKQLVATLDAGPRADLRAMAERQRRSVPAVRNAAWAAYDRYLKSNRVAAGIESYDHVLRLILGTDSRPSAPPGAPTLQN